MSWRALAGSGGAIACLGLVVAGAGAAPAAQRVVLAEEFTATWCGPCGPAGKAISRLLDELPGAFTALQIHQLDGFAIPWGHERAGFYGVQGFPTAWFDGVEAVIGGEPDEDVMYGIYLDKINGRLAVPTDVTIRLSASQIDGPTFRVRAEVGIEADGQGKSLRVYIVQVLDHFPVGDHHRNCLKLAAAEQELTLSPDQTETVTRQMTFGEQSWSDPQNIRIIAWAQQPAASGPAEVYQAAAIAWPFGGACAGDLDGDGETDQADLGILLADWGCAGGGCAGDLDGDGETDQADLGILLADWGCGAGR